MKQLRDENTRLKQLVAELTLDKTMLHWSVTNTEQGTE